MDERTWSEARVSAMKLGSSREQQMRSTPEQDAAQNHRFANSTGWAVLLAMVVILGLVLAAVLPDSVMKNDPSFYADRIAPLFQGKLPYFQFEFEHLPLAIVPMALAGAVERATGYSNYPIIFWALMSAVMFAIAYYVERVGRLLGLVGSARRWVLVAAGVIPLVTFRVDGLSLLLALMALYFMIRSADRPAAWALGAAIAAKGWPVILAVADWWSGRRRRAVLTVGITAVGGLALLTIPGFTSGRSFTGIHIETLSGSLVGLFRTATTSSARTVLNAGASYVEVGAWAPFLNAVVGLSLGLVALKLVRGEFAWDKAVGLLGVLIIALMLASPLLSAQFIIWVTPFAALSRDRRISLGAGAIALLTGIIVMFWHMDTVWWWSVIVVRNLGLVGLGWFWTWTLFRDDMPQRGRSTGNVSRAAPIAVWVMPLVLASLVPGLTWVVTERPMSIRLELALAMSFAVGVVALVALAVVSRGFTHRMRWSLSIATVVVLVLFQWPTLNNVGIATAAALRAPFVKEALPVLVATALLWLATRLGHEWQFAALLGTGLAVVVAGMIVIGSPRLLPKPAAVAEPAATEGPDVLLLVLDGYTRADVLASVFHHDNTAFYADLEDLGFVVPDKATANYSFTYGAMASMLELDYVFREGWLGSEGQQRLRQALSGDPELYRRFHEAGYEVSYAENGWSGSYCGPAVDICWRDGLGERVVWNLSRMTIFAPLLEGVRPHPFNTVSLEHLNALPDMFRNTRKNGVPRLTVAHVILPHPPLLLDESCTRQSDGARHPLRVSDPELLEQRRTHYADQVECVNNRLLDVLGEIISDNPDTLLMLTADHGAELTRPEDADVSLWTDDELASRMSIFSAYRLPGCDRQAGPTTTPVNGIRLTAGCALGEDMPTLPDRNYWVPSGATGMVIDVSERVDAS